MITLGIDIGSATSKVVILRDGKEILSKALHRAGIGSGGPDLVLQESLSKAGCKLGDIHTIVATGYGRNMLSSADGRISELSCHARGATFLAPGIRTLIDVGGQDAKVIRLDAKGRMQDFIMNDKCAAGTGRFMEVMAHVLDCDIETLSDLAAGEEVVSISSTCTVFAETEVISRLAAGASRSSIAAGVNRSISKRVAGLALRQGIVPKVMMSGGVAQNASLVAALSRELKTEILVVKECQYCGALGAAVLGWEKAQAGGLSGFGRPKGKIGESCE